MKSFLKQDPFKWLAVPPIGSGIPEHPLNILHLGLVIAAAFTQEGPPDIAIQIDRFSGSMVFSDMEDKHSLTADNQLFFTDMNVVVDLLIGMKN